MKNYTEYFDQTIDQPYYLRPMSWFELYFDIKCKGKPSCSINIDVIDIDRSILDILGIGTEIKSDHSDILWKFSD